MSLRTKWVPKREGEYYEFCTIERALDGISIKVVNHWDKEYHDSAIVTIPADEFLRMLMEIKFCDNNMR